MNDQVITAGDWQDAIDDWRSNIKVGRLWRGDPSLWTDEDEDRWVGWLSIVDKQLEQASQLIGPQTIVLDGGFSDVVLLGMGGSSLCPEVLARTFGREPGFPALRVLDSTDPSQIRTLESQIDIDNTLFIVASKSGSTLEPDILRAYFFERVGRRGDRFVAITDPGSKLEQIATDDGYRALMYGVPEIGGRYSALSNFGMVPAAAMGIDAVRFLERARVMANACTEPDPARNPGVELGLFLGGMANAGRNKLTLLTSPGLEALGAWLEQLIAESTGKEGKAIIPVDLEAVGDAGVYGDDRMFAVLELEGERAPAAPATHPCVRIRVESRIDLAQEFFRWEIATAVAGSVMGINPFNQPDVEASKIATRRLTDQYEAEGALPEEKPFFENDGIQLFGEGSGGSLGEILNAHVAKIGPGDYLALLAYIEMSAEHLETLQRIRTVIRDRTKAATCLGFGPRFLHSTGQAYKGGPNQAVVIQVTCDDSNNDLAVPGRKYSFGTVKAAQARGDLEVLVERERRALRVHLADVDEGLRALVEALG